MATPFQKVVKLISDGEFFDAHELISEAEEAAYKRGYEDGVRDTIY